MELKVNKSILWEQVGRDTQCAVKGMNVSTHISKKNSKLAFTENMWRQGLINLTDIIGRNCTRAESSEGGALPQLEACYRLRPTICGMSEASGKNAVGNEFSVIDNSTFRGNMLGYGCENISETCHNFPDCSRADAKRDDKWASISAALGKLKCPVANTAIGWLGLRFATALDFMKAQFTSVLNNLSEAESQLRGVILKEAAMAKEDICKKRESLEAGRSSIDSFKKQIASSKLQLSKFKNVSSQLTSEANDLTVRSSMATEVIEQVEKVVLSKKLAGNVLDTNGNAQIAAKNSFQAARDAALLVQKTSDAIQSLLRVCERAEEKVNERTISLTESIRTISSALDQAFSGGHGKNFSECESAFSLSSPPTPISGIDALLSALNGVVVSRDLGDVDATLAECKNEHSKLSDILGKASAGVDASVKGITEASKSASAAVDAARDVLLEAFKERERALCETVEHLVNVKMSALKLRERMERMKARAVSHVTRFLNAEVATKTVGRGKSDPIYSAQISDKRRRIEVISSEMENVASAILTEAGAVTKKSETQIGEIASTFDKAAREMTGKSVVLDEHVCKAGNEYTITAQLRPALASILTLMPLNNPTDLQAALGKMQRDFETLRQLRNEAKKIANEADVAALRAQQGDNVPACVPLFEQLLRALK
ncbi:hypothetical protein TRVL_08741 [Trypanosoma vivax]|nr:hypothetical protein TRVL_08741 [Trypanosoma vivax]